MPSTTISSTAVNADLSDIAAALTASVCSDGQTVITGQLKFPSGTAAAPSHTFSSDLTTGMYLAGAKKIGFGAGGVDTVFMDGNNIGAGQSGALIYYANGAIPSPVGIISDFGGSTAPSGWLLCFGQNVSQASYPELFFEIAFNFGNPGGGNFTLPDLRSRTTFGKDNMGGVAANRITVAGGNFDATVLGASGGGQNQTLTQPQLPIVTPTGTFSGAAQTPSSNQTNVETSNSAALTALGGDFFAAVHANRSAITMTFTPSGTIAINSFGSGNAHTILNPGMILNKMIFAGRP